MNFSAPVTIFELSPEWLNKVSLIVFTYTSDEANSA